MSVQWFGSVLKGNEWSWPVRDLCPVICGAWLGYGQFTARFGLSRSVSSVALRPRGR